LPEVQFYPLKKNQMNIIELVSKLDEATSQDEKMGISLQLKLMYSQLSVEEKEETRPFFRNRVENLLKKTHIIDKKLIKLGLARPEDIPGYGLYQ
jgi:hypothetical protein